MPSWLSLVCRKIKQARAYDNAGGNRLQESVNHRYEQAAGKKSGGSDDRSR